MFRALDYRGVMDVEGIFLDEYGLLVLELQYVVEVNVANAGSETLTLPVAWLPHFLNERNLSGEVVLSEEMVKGPGKNL